MQKKMNKINEFEKQKIFPFLQFIICLVLHLNLICNRIFVVDVSYLIDWSGT